jgi:hypothetical protein
MRANPFNFTDLPSFVPPFNKKQFKKEISTIQIIFPGTI